MPEWTSGAYIAEEVAPWIDSSGNLVAATGGRAVGTPQPGTPDTPAGLPGGSRAKRHPVQPTHASGHLQPGVTGRRGLYQAAAPFGVPLTPQQMHGLNSGTLPLISRSTKTDWVDVSRHGGSAPQTTTTSVYVTATGTTMVVQDSILQGQTRQRITYPVAKVPAPTQKPPDLTGFIQDYLKSWLNTPSGVGELPLGSGGGMMRPY